MHPAIGGDRNKRVLAYERKVGKGAVLYVGLGHTTVNRYDRGQNGQNPRPNDGYKGSWANPAFIQLAKNAISWAAA